MDKKYMESAPWIVKGVLILVLLIGGFGAWAAFAPISGAVIANGLIGVESKIKTIQHLDGGIVEKIYVRDGDKIEAGQLLVRLDDTTIRAKLAIITDHVYELLARQARLEAERDAMESITFPNELAQKSVSPKLNRIVTGETSLFEARRKSRQGQVRMLRQKIVQLKEQVNGLRAQAESKKVQTKIVRKNIEKKAPAAKRGIVSGDTMDGLRRQHAQLNGELGQLRSRVAEARSTVEETKLQILQIDADAREKVLSELRDVQTKIAELQEQRNATEQKLHRIDIRSPRTGRVHNLSIHTIGGVISPANPILQIIPEGDRLVVEARIEPTDIDNVKIGQEAGVRLSAFEARTTPMLDGKVKFISAAQLTDRASGMTYFAVEIDISPSELEKLTNGQVLLPGMPAEVFITTGERTALTILLQPFIDILDRAFRGE